MNIDKLKPWNWFKHEEGDSGGASQIPVARNQVAGSSGDPASLMSLHQEMDRWFEDAFKSFGIPSLARGASAMPATGDGWRGYFRPRIDVSGDDNRYQVDLDVPGLTADDLSLELDGDVLVIKGQKAESNETRDRHYYRVERSYGAFQRTLALPDDANADEIKADLDKGVLRLEIPRRAGAGGDVKRIAISA